MLLIEGGSRVVSVVVRARGGFQRALVFFVEIGRPVIIVRVI